MAQPASFSASKQWSVRALEAANFFLADVQTGLGPFLAAYLSSAGWNPEQVGIALTWGGLMTVIVQTPAGGLVDRAHAKRAILIAGIVVLACGAGLLAWNAQPWSVYLAQTLIGGTAPFLAPTLAAISLGLVGSSHFDRQFGRNQSFNSAGNVACALGIAAVSGVFGSRSIFLLTILLSAPAIFSVAMIRGSEIDHTAASGGFKHDRDGKRESFTGVLSDRVLATFLVSAFLFHLANAAMLPELGEMLAHGSAKTAAPFMSACVIVTQVVITSTAAWIGRYAHMHGRKHFLLVGFGVLPVRALLYTLTQQPAILISIQILDGLANAVFTVVSVLVVADRTRGTGRFNLVQGMLATAVGLGASLSNTLGGHIAQHWGFRASFYALGLVALLAFALVLLGVPETLPSADSEPHP